jgi:uncharacterized DUF497 family protein
MQNQPFSGFDWDKGNARKNEESHGVIINECEQVFFNQPNFGGKDSKHSHDEERYFIYGSTNSKRLLFVVYTLRDGKIRVISARDMNKKERKAFHEKVKNYTEI